MGNKRCIPLPRVFKTILPHKLATKSAWLNKRGMSKHWFGGAILPAREGWRFFGKGKGPRAPQRRHYLMRK